MEHWVLSNGQRIGERSDETLAGKEAFNITIAVLGALEHYHLPRYHF